MPISERGQLGRSMGLFGTTGVGVGAIVGGGILALAGVAFISTGPSAIVAFAANGAIAILTALSFAEMAAAFPESGGTYIFSKKVLSAPAAFMVGWVVWFASVIAGVLYALGFASFTATGLETAFRLAHLSLPFSLTSRTAIALLAMAATAGYGISLGRKTASGGQWATWGKVLVFLIIIVSGFLAISRRSLPELGGRFHPFFNNGIPGLFQAMGYTFIALQGFDLIASVAGEVKDPARNIPRGMLLSLAIALAVYLPLLLVVNAVGTSPDWDIVALSRIRPDTVVAEAVRNFLGSFGYWLVMVAAVLAMLSALRANLMAASRVVLSMAVDRSLPPIIGRIDPHKNTPIRAIALTTAMVMALLLVISNVAAAGAAASLIFLVSFALTHWTAILARMRVGAGALPFLAPWFPVVPVIGGGACLCLAVFQGIQVPSAGLVCALWLGAGLVLYLVFFARRSRIVDASSVAMDPRILTLRGQNPLVLVPIANPANAGFLVSLAGALAPPAIGRILLLSIMNSSPDGEGGDDSNRLPDRLQPRFDNSQIVLKAALTVSIQAGLTPEALITIAPRVWSEVIRVAHHYRCGSLLIGLSDLNRRTAVLDLEQLMSRVDADVVVVRARTGWDISLVRRVLVPVAGGGEQDYLRARLIGSLRHMGIDEVTFLRILAEDASEEEVEQARQRLRELAEDEGAAIARSIVIRSRRPAEEIIRLAADTDLLILGLQRQGRRRKVFGEVVLQIAGRTTCSLILINRKG